MKLLFSKMHGAGNDFVVIDGIGQRLDLSAEQFKRLADRRFGIGADQILIVEQPTEAGCDFRYRIYNSDGGEVEQCGNGARAFVKFVVEKGLLPSHLPADVASTRGIRVQTMAGIITPRLQADGSVSVDMGAPVLAPAAVPFDTRGLAGQAAGLDTLWPLALTPEHTIAISLVSMGNPHAVLQVDDVDAAPVGVLGAQIEQHARFPKRANAGFMQVLDRGHIKLRVFERGVGETLACGTGSCAAVVAGIRRGLLDSPVRVSARGGELTIAWEGEGAPVTMSGPAVTVFDGEITL